MADSKVKSWDSWFSPTVTKVLFGASVVFAIVVASAGWNNMLSPLYAFRQTQTAISVSYLLKGGPWLAYQTPVLGPPWSLPFEFPLYQWLVALVVKAGLFELNQAGRFVSELFFFLALYPLFRILALLGVTERQRYLTLTLCCLSPLYLSWSRAFLIESTALCLSLYYLWLVLCFTDRLGRGQWRPALLVPVALLGALAGVVKVTTFYAFLAGACLALAFVGAARYRAGSLTRQELLRLALAGCAAGLVPVLAIFAWTAYSDGIKVLNPLAAGLTSSSLSAWNFGTLAQRFSLKTWQVHYYRTLSDLVGNSLLALVALAGLFFCRKEQRRLALVSLGLFLLTLLTFTNLQVVHGYYPYAIGFFFLAAVGIAAGGLLESRALWARGAGLLLLGALVVCSMTEYFGLPWQLQMLDFDFQPIQEAVNRHSGPDDVFIVFGSDWSSEIPYYLDRRAAMIKSGKLDDPALPGLKRNLKGYRIGGVVFFFRQGYRPERLQFMREALLYFGVQPGDSVVTNWYKGGAELITVFNSAK